MAKRDLRPEQLQLLRFEKLIKNACREVVAGKKLDKAPVLAGLPLLAAASAVAAHKLAADAPLQYAEKVAAAAHSSAADEAWLTQLATVVTTGHNVIENLAQNGAFLLLQANGTPKRSTSEFVQSLLMNGLS